MLEYYNFKNIHQLLVEGFTENELRQRLCLYETDFNPLFNQLAKQDDKETIVYKIVDFANQRLKIDALLTWAKQHNPQRYENHKPYYQKSDSVSDSLKFSAELEENQLGYGLTLGGSYQGSPLKVAAIEWAQYGRVTKVRSGWLYILQWTQSHAIAFFKIHVTDEGAGYIHIVDVAHPSHKIWLKTVNGYVNEKQFHYIEFPSDVWQFQWRETNYRLFPQRYDT